MGVDGDTEFQDEDQLIVLYMRDINDDYMRRTDVVMRHATEPSGVVTLNIRLHCSFLAKTVRETADWLACWKRFRYRTISPGWIFTMRR